MAERQSKKKASGRRKTMTVFGIIFVAAGIFLLAFGLSFKIMMLPEKNAADGNSPEAQIERLEEENAQLKEDIRRLEEENEILMGGGSITSIPTVSGTSSSSGSPSASNSSGSSGDSSSSKSSGSSTSSGTGGTSGSSKKPSSTGTSSANGIGYQD